MQLRHARDAALLDRERTERAPALLFPIGSAVVRLHLQDATHQLDRATFALVPARAPYRVEPVGSLAPLVTLLVEPADRAAARREYAPHFQDATLARIVAEPRVLPRTRWVDELVQRYLFERTVCERDDSPAARFLETELTKELFFLGQEALEDKTRSSAVAEEGDVVARARALLEQHLFEPLSMPALARACHASESTLLRAFRREVGVPPAVFQRSRRLEEALLLLEGGRYGAGEVALRVGYASASAFSVAFQRRFGVPPSQVARARPGADDVLPPHGRAPLRTVRRARKTK